MGVATIIGIVVAAIGILGGYMVEGGSIMSLFNIPGFMIVVVGTLGATTTAFPLSQTLGIPGAAIRAMTGGNGAEPREMAEHLVEMADKARREGLLSLEEEAQKLEEPFARKGLMLMIDGTDPEALQSIMEIDLDQEAGRLKEQSEIWKVGSGFSPTLGVLGAVMSLITVLSGLGGDVAALGHGIAVAVRGDVLRRRSGQHAAAADPHETERDRRRRAAGPRDDPRGRAVDPGRRQPADRSREAAGLPRAREQAAR